MNRRLLAKAVIACTLYLAASTSAELPLSDPLWSWMRPVATSGGRPLHGIVPICGLPSSPREGWVPLVDRAAGLGDEGRHRLGDGWLGLDGLVAVEGGSDQGSQIRAGTALRLQADVYGDLSVWSGSDEVPPMHFTGYHLGQEEGRHLYADWGYALWNPGTVSLRLGRVPQIWGPGRYNNLLLSNNSPPLDMLMFTAEPAQWLSFSGLTASVSSDSSTYLSLHRLDITPASSLRLGLSEAILYCSDGMELAYMNPFIPYYPIQWNERDDDNAFICFDGEWSPLPGLSAWGELLVDDLQYQSKFNRPNKLAWTVGAEVAARGGYANLEYTRIDRYVYSQRRTCNYYLHDNRIIGSPLGPDADCVTLGAGWAGLWPLAARASLEHVRNGEGDIYEGWPDSASAGEPFPSGTVEYRTGAALRISAFLARGLELHGGLSHLWLRNHQHVNGAMEEESRAWAQAVWNW